MGTLGGGVGIVLLVELELFVVLVALVEFVLLFLPDEEDEEGFEEEEADLLVAESLNYKSPWTTDPNRRSPSTDVARYFISIIKVYIVILSTNNLSTYLFNCVLHK